MKIIGAGLSGLIAGHIFHGAKIIECNDRIKTNHKALLRFRTNKVSQVTGIPFRKVVVYKAIWCNGEFHQPNPTMANAYSQKCTGEILQRSIWNIDPCERWIAPDNFADQLADQLADRIVYGVAWNFNEQYDDVETIISTVPMKYLTDKTAPLFHHKKIHVYRADLGPIYDVFQTVYFPDKKNPIYRATITGRTLIVESVEELSNVNMYDVDAVFDISCRKLKFEMTAQKFGKITPIDDNWRRNFIHQLTLQRKIYSLGRFAIWKNILLDDVVDDCYVIKRLIRADAYDNIIIRSGYDEPE